jgi:PTH1 family peptidyl-tRNA hydrolase
VPWLIAGLGNPGERYSNTRHNLGASVVALLASRNGGRFRKVRFLPLEVADSTFEGESVFLARSQRYMNESGPSYASFARKRDIDAAHLVAVHDDIDLGAGGLRVRIGGSNGGHNGLRSLQSALGTADFHRVKLGVGRPPGRQDPADFVLQPMGRKERDDFDVLVEEAADAVLSLVRDGLAVTQDRYNRGGTRG